MMHLHTVSEINIPLLRLGDKILQENIAINWLQGQQWCIVGPNGSGKTALLKTIVGLQWMPGATVGFPQIESEIRLLNDDIHVSDKVAFVPQEIRIPSGFLPDLFYQRRYHATEQDDIPTVWQVLQRQSVESTSLVDEVSTIMNLTKLIDQPFVQLSNGQTRRLMIAIALLKQPSVLILDNPYTGLDQQARESLNRQLMLLIDSGIHIMMASHDHEVSDASFITNKLLLNPIESMSDDVEMPDFYNVSPDSNKSCTPIIEMNDIKIRYGDAQVLSLVRWIVMPEDRWLIRGLNGSGKSTLLSLIVADHPQAYSNDISILGRKRGSGESIWDVKRKIGYFSSELLRYFSPRPLARQVVASGWNDIVGQIDTSVSEHREELVDKLCSWLGISFMLDVRFGDLSFGQQKMVLIARAMVRNPELLILDEPLQGMDIYWQERFKVKIDEFSVGRTLLYVTHDEHEIPKGEWNQLNLSDM